MTDALPEGLPGKVIAVDQALAGAGIPHQFGGALALAYYAEPRATNDIDVNVALPSDRAADVLDALPQCKGTEDAVRQIERDGQIRLWWDRTPVDLFFREHEFHDWLAANAQDVPFAGRSIPIISGEGLLVCKALFNRGKDWVDIDAMVAAGGVTPSTARPWLTRLLGDDHAVVARFDELVSRRASRGLGRPGQGCGDAAAPSADRPRSRPLRPDRGFGR